MPKERVSRKYRLTRKLCLSFPPNDPTSRSTDQEYSDSEIPGLKLFVSKTGRKSWHLRYTLNRRRCIKLADFDCLPIPKVRELAQKYRGMINQKIDPMIERDRITEVPTFSEFSVTYIEWAKAHKRSWKDDANKLKEPLMVSTFSKEQMSTITSKKIQDYLIKIKERTSPSTSNRHRSLVQKMYALLISWEIIPGKNPCSRVPKFSEDNAFRRRALESFEIKLFVNALNEYKGSVIALLLKFLLYSGLRLGESKTLLISDVLDAQIHIRMENAKSKKSRYIEISPLIRSVLDELKEVRSPGNPYLFPGLKPNSHLVNPNKLFGSVQEKIGITDFSIHSLRHTFATCSVQAGNSLYVVQSQLGHASFKTTQKYAHICKSQTTSASLAVANKFSEILGG
ncbi:MAG: site-specific integrase [Bacteroidales bacterium]|jgi:integrase|nr:site-specific integrase [Bacteroidales bacterium]